MRWLAPASTVTSACDIDDGDDAGEGHRFEVLLPAVEVVRMGIVGITGSGRASRGGRSTTPPPVPLIGAGR